MIGGACQEARQCVASRYKKLIVASSEEIQGLDPCHPFLYVRYELDTVFLDLAEWNRESEQDFLYGLSQVQFLAVQCELQPDNFEIIETLEHLRPLGEILSSVTFVAMHDYHHDKMGQGLSEWTLVEIPASEVMGLPTPPPFDWDFPDDRESLVAIDELGNMVYQCAAAYELKTTFCEYQMDHPEWRNISVSCSLLAIKEVGLGHWCIHYWVEEPDEIMGCIMELGTDAEDDESWMSGCYHWHKEPINLGNGTVESCTVFEENNRLNMDCERCIQKRWIETNDAFWLDCGKKHSGVPLEDRFFMADGEYSQQSGGRDSEESDSVHLDSDWEDYDEARFDEEGSPADDDEVEEPHDREKGIRKDCYDVEAAEA
jgi:hypothetical protein